jgi:hypothetical protein
MRKVEFYRATAWRATTRTVAQFQVRARRALLDIAALTLLSLVSATLAFLLADLGSPTRAQMSALFGACALSAGLVSIFYFLRRSAGENFAEDVSTRIDEKISPNSGHYTHRVALKPAKKMGEFRSQMKSIPESAREIMIELRQRGKHEPEFVFASMTEQLMQFLTKFRPETDVEWICVVNSSGRFFSYQRLESLLVTMMVRRSNLYVDLLNQSDPELFEKAIGQAIPDLSGFQAVFPADYTGDAWTDTTKEGTSRRSALLRMTKNSIEHTMIVTRRKEKPVGVMTAAKLVDDILIPALADGDKVASQQPTDMGSGSPPDDPESAVYEADDLAAKQAAARPLEDRSSGLPARIAH